MLMPTPPEAAKSVPSERDNIVADLCILGAGPGGLSLAAGAAALGHKVVLIEKHKMGGTSLHYGSVPVKALLASAEHAQAMRGAGAFGIAPFEPAVDWPGVRLQIADIIAQSAPNAAAERLTGLGVTVIQAAGRFVDPRTVIAGEVRISARRFVIATGTAPFVPAVSGLEGLSYSTTDTIAEARGPIDHLIIVGGGAAGVEFAQAYRRLGARVTLVEQAVVLGRFDRELASVIKTRLVADGVVMIEGATVGRIESSLGRIRLDVSTLAGRSKIEGSHLLMACGRRPVMTDLGLEAAKIASTVQGITVNSSLRTSNRRVYAMGDVIGLPYSTHRAEYHGGLLLRTLLYKTTAKVNPRLVPASIHTDPELATVGLTEAEAQQASSSIQVLRWPMRENDRALVNRSTAGHIKVIADASGKILGAGIVSRSAGEMIGVWSLAISKGLNLDDMSAWIAPYPSLGEVGPKVALQRSGSALGRAVGRRWIRFLTRLG